MPQLVMVPRPTEAAAATAVAEATAARAATKRIESQLIKDERGEGDREVAERGESCRCLSPSPSSSSSQHRLAALLVLLAGGEVTSCYEGAGDWTRGEGDGGGKNGAGGVSAPAVAAARPH